MLSHPIRPFLNNTRCHWCDYFYALRHDNTCPRCHTPFDAEKALAAKIRNEKGYKERLSVTEKKIMRMNRTGYMEGTLEDTLKKINEYLKKKGAQRATFNGMDIWEIQAKRSYYPKKKDRTD